MISRKVWEVGPCPWRTVEKKRGELARQREAEAEARAAIEKANREARQLAAKAKRKEARRA